LEVKWAFSNANAAAGYADFYNDVADLDKIDWAAVQSTEFSSRNKTAKDHKQAEFLIYGSFPWHWFEEIGTIDAEIQEQVAHALQHSEHRPRVSVRRNWYF
jgi:hypothetical protein